MVVFLLPIEQTVNCTKTYKQRTHKNSFPFILVTEPYLMHGFGHTQFCIPNPKAFLYPNTFSGLKYSH